jgi:hypothetical protein
MAPFRSGRCLLLVALVQTCAAFSTFAGSCKHAGVQHGLDRFAAQECVGATLRCARRRADSGGCTLVCTAEATAVTRCRCRTLA